MTLLRETVIVFALLLFLILPGRVNSVLTQAGFTKAAFAGFEVDLQASVDNTKSASETIGKLEEQLKEMSVRLDDIGRKSSEPAVKEQISNLSVQVEKTHAETRAVGKILDASVAKQQSIIRQVSPQVNISQRAVRPKE